ncbi:MAG TPA: O-antigen ligase family protein [Abditibacteriaceae bacterium]|jgi:O-antigen ligase
MSIWLMAVVLLAPVLVTQSSDTSQEMRMFVLQAATLGILGLLLVQVRWSFQGIGHFFTTRLNLAIVLFVAWATLSFLLMAPGEGRGHGIARTELMRLASGAAIYLAMLYGCRSRNSIRAVSLLLLAAGFLAAGAGILSTGVLNSSSLSMQVAAGNFGNKQLLAAFLVVLLPIAVVYTCAGVSKSQRTLAAATAILLAVALLLTGNRTSWVSGVAGLLCIAVLAYKTRVLQVGTVARLVREKHCRLAVALALLVLAASVGAVCTNGGTRQMMQDRFTPWKANLTLQSRLRLWSVCGQMILARPLVGWGIGSFALKAGDYPVTYPAGLPDEARILSATQVEMQGTSLSTMAHNEYLQTAAELGLVGLMLYMAILGGFFYYCIRSLKRMEAGTRKWLLLSALGAVAAQCVDALGNPGWHFGDVSPLLWLMMGVGTAASSTNPVALEMLEKPYTVSSNLLSDRRIWHFGTAIGLVVLCCGWANRAFAGAGFIPTAEQDDDTHAFLELTAEDLAAYLNRIPQGFVADNPRAAYAETLIVMSQCYGGSLVPALSKNRVIASGTTGAEVAFSRDGTPPQGYGASAAAALKPGAGRTALTVHQAGVSGKIGSQTPSSSGDLASFSLKDTSDTEGGVRARYVIVYAGQPNARHDYMASLIKTNFAGQQNTEVVTIGGGGQHRTGRPPWDRPATGGELNIALLHVRDKMRELANSPGKVQLIFFVTDHGGYDGKIGGEQSQGLNSPQLGPRSLGLRALTTASTANFPTFASAELNPADLAFDPTNNPGFSFFIDFYEAGLITATDPFHPGDWQITLHHPTAGDFFLTYFTTAASELDMDGIIGNQPGEGVRVFFQMSEPTFINSFFDVIVDIDIQNNTAFSWQLKDLTQTTGVIAERQPGDVTTTLGGRIITESAALSPAGVNVYLTQGSAIVATTTTDAGGNYFFTRVAPGLYTLTPAKAGLAFSSTTAPFASFRNVGVSEDNVSDQDFGAFLVTSSKADLHVSGNGEIATQHGPANFTFQVKTDKTGTAKGFLNLDVGATATAPAWRVQSSEITALEVSGNHAQFFGWCTTGGIKSLTFQVFLVDVGEPGAKRDKFRIELSNGYVAGGQIVGDTLNGGEIAKGNLQIHKVK